MAKPSYNCCLTKAALFIHSADKHNPVITRKGSYSPAAPFLVIKGRKNRNLLFSLKYFFFFQTERNPFIYCCRSVPRAI